MRDLIIKDTTIINKTSYTGIDGRKYAELEIAFDDFNFKPGQFMMIKTTNMGVNWSYPYMIINKSEKGFRVIAKEDTSIFNYGLESKVTVFGPGGKGVEIEDEGYIVVAEGATYPLVSSFVKNSDGKCEKVIFVGKENEVQFPVSDEEHGEVYFEDINKASEFINNAASKKIIIALNLDTLLPLMEKVQEDKKDNILVFVSTKMGCGVGACRGCYIHSPEVKTGISVCCEGPFMPYKIIDFEVDKKCFQTFK